ncbi:MAG: hypothetical protein R6V53_03620 [Candidatus Woesearchaeota archaeon]
MKERFIKFIGALFVGILVVNLVLFATGYITVGTFWLVIILGAVVAFLIPKLNRKLYK